MQGAKRELPGGLAGYLIGTTRYFGGGGVIFSSGDLALAVSWGHFGRLYMAAAV